MEEWPRVEGTGFPIQGSLVQNHWVAPRLTQPLIRPRLIKWVQGISESLVVKSYIASYNYAKDFPFLNTNNP